VIEDKLNKFRYELSVARNLVKNQYADQNYYKEIISHLEKLIVFYEKLKSWREIGNY
jgi:hypothetical protein